jgi:hypothetical protein
MSLHDKHVSQIEAVTADLRKVRQKIDLLGDMQGLSSEQARAVRSLGWGLDGIRGWELGIARQEFGLDADLRRAAGSLIGKGKT